METFSLRPLSEGLGFYEDKPVLQSVNKNGDKKQLSAEFSCSLPDDILPKNLDLNDLHTYEHLLSLLEKPWLGGENILNSESGKSSLFEDIFPSSNPSPVATPSVLQDEIPSPPFPSDQRVASVRNTDSKKGNVKKHGWIFRFFKKLVKTNKVDVAKMLQSNERKAQSENASLTLSLAFEKTFYFSLKSYITDAFIVSLLFFPPLVSFLFLTQSEPEAVLWSIWPKILIAFLFFSQIYCLVCRLFCFETFGEAVAKMRLFTLGSQEEIHPFLLFWRFFFSCLTGVVFLPLLSLIFRKDFLARLTGLYFQKTEMLKS